MYISVCVFSQAVVVPMHTHGILFYLHKEFGYHFKFGNLFGILVSQYIFQFCQSHFTQMVHFEFLAVCPLCPIGSFVGVTNSKWAVSLYQRLYKYTEMRHVVYI